MSDYEYDSDNHTNDEYSHHSSDDNSSDNEEIVVAPPPKKSQKKTKGKKKVDVQETKSKSKSKAKTKAKKEQVSEDEEELGANDTKSKDEDNGFSQKIKMVNDVICSITEHHTTMMEAFKESYNTYKAHITEYKQQMKELSQALRNVEKYRKDVVKANKKRKSTGSKTSGINAKKPVPQLLIDFFDLEDDAEKSFNEVVALMRTRLEEFKLEVKGDNNKKIKMYELDKKTLKELNIKEGHTLFYENRNGNQVTMELHKFPITNIQKFVKYFYDITDNAVATSSA